jgi:hypothetical protein
MIVPPYVQLTDNAKSDRITPENRKLSHMDSRAAAPYGAPVAI